MDRYSFDIVHREIVRVRKTSDCKTYIRGISSNMPLFCNGSRPTETSKLNLN
jgi:hypothetical protein